jgi:thiol reductant ABC exporter CydC subunit
MSARPLPVDGGEPPGSAARAGAAGWRASARALAASGRLHAGERGRLALAVALSAGAMAAAVGLLATSGYLISRAAERPAILALMVAIVAVRAFGLTRAGLRYAERLCSHDLALRQLARLRARFYERLWPLVPGELRHRGGDLLARFVGDVDALSDLYLRALIPGLVAAAAILGASFAAWLVLPAAGLALLASMSASALALPWLAATVAARADRRQAGARARLASVLVEGIDAADELRMLGCSGERVRALDDRDRELSRPARSDALAEALASTLGGVLAGAGLIAVLAVGIAAVHAGSLAGVLLAALAFLALGAYEGVAPLPAAARSLRACATAARRLQEVCSRRPAVVDPPVPRRCGGGGELRVEGAAFRYSPDGPWLLRDLELSLAAGERVALVGANGAGKSTLAELLVRFHDPERGRITLDGIDVRELAQEDLRRAVLLCGQDARLFNTTVRENLLLARRDASERELEDALACVELDAWVERLPAGLDTLVGADGELVSGGQRQRIALARALLCDARFVILDEPTAHLDAALARRVMQRVLRACGDRGTLVITHDAGLLAEDWDRIVCVGKR